MHAITTVGRRRLAGASLFVRLLLLLVVTVLAVQAVTFILVLAMPTPSPSSFTLSALTHAARTGRTNTSQFRVSLGEPPVDNWTDPYERKVGTAVAAALKLPENRVRFISLRELAYGPPARPSPPDEAVDLHAVTETRAAAVTHQAFSEKSHALEQGTVTGPFQLSVRLASGHWRSVWPASVAKWKWEILLWLVGSTAVVAPFAWFFAKRIAAPIAAFSAAARRIGTNPAAAPVSITGPPEIMEASVAVNEMQRQLARYIEDRTMMLGAIAHDLRTPLMRLSLRLQAAPDTIRTACEQEIDGIRDMANAALSFVRDISVQESRHRIALRSLVETVADEFADHGADVVLDAGEDATVLADLNGIKRMLTNLVGNAVVHAGSARIRIGVTDRQARVEVADTGPGIPPAELDHVFAPFYRVDQSRNRHTGGTGLGLASARAVARAHGGDIVLSNLPEGGLLAVASLPL